MRRRWSTVLVVALSLVWLTPVRVAAAEPPGWRPVLVSAFDGTGLPAGCTATDAAGDGSGGSAFRPEAVTVVDGHLRLTVQRRASGGKAFTGGELRCTGAAQRFGRYEFRARAPRGVGLDSLVMLRPVSGDTRRHGSQVELVAPPGAEKAYVSNGYGTGVTSRTVPGGYSEFRTYLIEWAPTGFKVFVDGQQRLVDPRVTTEPRWLGFAVTAGDARAGQPTTATTLPAVFEIDFLRVWAYDPAASAVPTPPPASTGAPAPLPAAATPPPPGRDGWFGLLAGLATLALVLAAGAFVIHRTRPRRPPSGHRL